MRKPLAVLLIFVLGMPFVACGDEPQTAAEFCQPHGGINVATQEPDGDVTCNDGTEYEADGDTESESSDKKKKKKRSKRR